MLEASTEAGRNFGFALGYGFADLIFRLWPLWVIFLILGMLKEQNRRKKNQKDIEEAVKKALEKDKEGRKR